MGPWSASAPVGGDALVVTSSISLAAVPYGLHRSLISLFLLSKFRPLRWAGIWFIPRPTSAPVGADAHIAPLGRLSGFCRGNVPPAGGFLLVQKVTKDTPGGGAFNKDAPPPVPPPSEDWIDVLIPRLGDFVNRIAPPPKISKTAKGVYAIRLFSFSIESCLYFQLHTRNLRTRRGPTLARQYNFVIFAALSTNSPLQKTPRRRPYNASGRRAIGPSAALKYRS